MKSIRYHDPNHSDGYRVLRMVDREAVLGCEKSWRECEVLPTTNRKKKRTTWVKKLMLTGVDETDGKRWEVTGDFADGSGHVLWQTQMDVVKDMAKARKGLGMEMWFELWYSMGKHIVFDFSTKYHNAPKKLKAHFLLNHDLHFEIDGNTWEKVYRKKGRTEL